MATIHMALQGKGGVGKSFISAVLAQYIRERIGTPLCYDTDPVNHTFAGFKALSVETVELMDGTELDPRLFDPLMATMLAADDEQHIIVDSGASSFVPLLDYLVTSEVPRTLREEGHTLYIHSVIVGGQGLADTLGGLASVLSTFPEVPCVTWLNPVHGPVSELGTDFEDMPVYEDHSSQIAAIIRIPELPAKTSGRDLSDLLTSRRTFGEAIDDPQLGIMVRQRLKMIQRDIYQQISASNVL